MQILLANAKIMYDKADKAPCSTPLFESVADKLAAEMARMEAVEAARMEQEKISGDAGITNAISQKMFRAV